MSKLDHFRIFSKALALAYICFGVGVSWNMVQGQHWASALVVIAVSVFFRWALVSPVLGVPGHDGFGRCGEYFCSVLLLSRIR
ncbi:hypothetical protein [Lysobacter capsici]|uniref:hypothetical protein n=1 Tax=Lysobacter capsici TaxID=435897 RepID=UPI0012FE2A0F|nr:hypothetical protein [Lysobacter capsici]